MRDGGLFEAAVASDDAGVAARIHANPLRPMNALTKLNTAVFSFAFRIRISLNRRRYPSWLF